MKVEVLGNVQDGGVPHLGCECDTCEDARKKPEKRRYSSSILLKEDSSEDSIRYLIDATPDIRFQTKAGYLDGVFVPHSELGHVTGLLYFGHEGIDASKVSVYCNKPVENFLMRNDPFRYLVDRENIEIHNFEDGDTYDLQGGEIEVVELPHSHISRDTASYMIKGEDKKLYYLSDINEFNGDVIESVKEADIAIIDGTFWSRDEIDRFDEVPHPPIKESIEEMKDIGTEIYFTHINHTNPVLKDNSAERQELQESGFNIAEEGMVFEL